MNFDLEKFGQRLSLLLSKNNMTQTELAKRLGVTDATISRYISGSRSPYMEIAIEMSKIFNVSIEYLLGLIDEEKKAAYENFDDDIDANLNVLAKKIFNLEENQNLSDNQIDAMKKLICVNEGFILSV